MKGERKASKIDRVGNKTRIQRWKRYREKIKALPDASFDTKKGNAISFSKVDRARLEGSVQPSYAPRLETTAYKSYLARKRRNLLLKSLALILTVVLFVLLYVFWVEAR